jgi:hypothetical protein
MRHRMPLLPSLADRLSRSADRPMRRPAGLVGWLDTPRRRAFGGRCSMSGVPSVNLTLAAAPAAASSSDPAEATRFLRLSVLAVAPWQARQLLTRGPVASGYPVPGTHAPAMHGAYAAAGAAGAGFAVWLATRGWS